MVPRDPGLEPFGVKESKDVRERERDRERERERDRQRVSQFKTEGHTKFLNDTVILFY